MKPLTNARADYSDLLCGITVQFEVKDLPKSEQLRLLRYLMEITGTTTAIYSGVLVENKQKLDWAVTTAWCKFAEQP
jgi:hypothetical protein